MTKILRPGILLVLTLTILVGASPRAQGLRGLTADGQKSVQMKSGGYWSVCGATIGPPAALPPNGSSPVILAISPCFERQGGVPHVSIQVYLRDIQLRPSIPSAGQWVAYDAAAERRIFDDFQGLWNDNAIKLSDLSIDISDYVFSNGVIGKVVVYNMTERN